MLVWQIIFWLSVLVIFYNYAGYALILFVINRLRPKKTSPETESFVPSVSFIVAAFNEEDCIEKKILNSLNVYILH